MIAKLSHISTLKQVFFNGWIRGGGSVGGCTRTPPLRPGGVGLGPMSSPGFL